MSTNTATPAQVAAFAQALQTIASTPATLDQRLEAAETKVRELQGRYTRAAANGDERSARYGYLALSTARRELDELREDSADRDRALALQDALQVAAWEDEQAAAELEYTDVVEYRAAPWFGQHATRVESSARGTVHHAVCACGWVHGELFTTTAEAEGAAWAHTNEH